MSFKSESQRRKFFAMESRGEISTDTLNEWQAATPKGKKLPERLGKKKEGGLPASFLRPTAIGLGAGTLGGGLLGAAFPLPDDRNKPATADDRWRSAKMWGAAGGTIGGLAGAGKGLFNVVRDVDLARRTRRAAEYAKQEEEYLARETARRAEREAADAARQAEYERVRAARAAERAARREKEFGGLTFETPPASDEKAQKIHKLIMDTLQGEKPVAGVEDVLSTIKTSAFIDELTKIADLAGLVLSQIARSQVAPPVAKGVSDVEEAIAEKWRRFTTPEDLGYRPGY